MRIAQIKNGVVINVIEADSVWSSNGSDSYIASDDAGIGWVLVDGVLQEPPKDYIAMAEAHIESHFSTARLLQCKVWLDLLPHEATPKLMSLFAWTASITGAAIQGQSELSSPPVTFVEVAQECIPQLPS